MIGHKKVQSRWLAVGSVLALVNWLVTFIELPSVGAFHLWKSAVSLSFAIRFFFFFYLFLFLCFFTTWFLFFVGTLLETGREIKTKVEMKWLVEQWTMKVCRHYSPFSCIIDPFTIAIKSTLKSTDEYGLCFTFQLDPIVNMFIISSANLKRTLKSTNE